ncbi:MAG: hypothetical protein IPP27_08385 [Bacteroidetes bacterium]|nr:hypothetical protein [Bacteroidota bacterium]
MRWQTGNEESQESSDHGKRLVEAVRKKINTPELDTVKEIYMERSGELSVVTKD